jgi:hypothetical protein
MHLLPNMATEADNVLRIFEDVALLAKETQFSFKTDESGTARTIPKVVYQLDLQH